MVSSSPGKADNIILDSDVLSCTQSNIVNVSRCKCLGSWAGLCLKKY